jgi:TolB-like protein/Tfp pilus assembly protein PilF
VFWQTKISYEFGRFRVDTRERQLLRDGEVVALTPKVFDVLLVLVQNSGHVLSKDEVMKLVWPDSVVEEGSIARNISTLRKALGESPVDLQYVETVPWRGYRFVANVSEVKDRNAGPSLDSIAVLPFVNHLSESNLEYLADGLTESVIGNLARLAPLRVMSRNSVFRYKGREPDAQVVARELNVRAVLIGRVTERARVLSICVELVDGLDGSRLWGAQYGRDLADIFSLPETVAREIAEHLRLHLTGEEVQRLRKRYTDNGEAYQSYLKGRYYFHKLTPEGVQKGIECFRQAIEQDANYALAYAGLGDCYTYLEKSAEAGEAFGRALELDQALGEAHASLGFYKFLYNWDWRGAEEEFLQAIDLTPNYAEAHHWYAIYLAHMERHREALREAECARELDPLSLLMNMTPGLTSYLARHYDEAVEAFQHVIEMEPNFLAARSMLGSAYEQQGCYEKAIAEYRMVLQTFGENADVRASIKALLARSYAAWGKRAKAKRIVQEIEKEYPATSYLMTQVFGTLGEKERAFAYLEKAFAERHLQLVGLKADPGLDSLRADCRYENFVRRMRL